MKCPKCGTENSESAKFCGFCGEAFLVKTKITCSHCKHENSIDFKFCEECGQLLIPIHTPSTVPTFQARFTSDPTSFANENHVKQSLGKEKQTPTIQTDETSGFFKSLFLTAIPMITLIGIVVAMAGRGGASIWWLTLAFCILVMLVCSGFAIAGKRRIALGILIGIVIGLVGLVISCSTVLH